jgi:hypothetical protein
MSGRAPVRTDYVYTVTSDGSWDHENPVHRTLKGALAEASTGLFQPTVTKTGPNTWRVMSEFGTGNHSIVTRTPLVN